jgi:hypothetical protein
MNKTFGFFKDKLPRGNVTSSNYPMPTYDISVATSNVANPNITDTITFTFETNLPNKTVYWAVSNTSTSVDFTNGITSGNFVLDAFGNATFSKQILINSTDNVNKNFNFLFSHNDPLSSETFFTQQANITTIHTITHSITKISGDGGGNVITSSNTFENPGPFKLLRFTAGGGPSGNNPTDLPSNFNLSFNTIYNSNISIDYLLVGPGGSRGGYDTTFPTSSQAFWGTGGGAGGDVVFDTTNIANTTIYNVIVGNAPSSFNPSSGKTVPPSSSNASSAFSSSASGSGNGGSFYQQTTPPYFTSSGPTSGGGGNAVSGGASKVYTNGTYTGGAGVIRYSGSIPVTVAGGGGTGAGGSGSDAVVVGGGTGTDVLPGNSGIGYVSNITGVAVAYGQGGVGLGGRDGFSTKVGSAPIAPGATVNGSYGVGSGAGSVGLSGVVYVKYKPFQKGLSV